MKSICFWLVMIPLGVVCSGQGRSLMDTLNSLITKVDAQTQCSANLQELKKEKNINRQQITSLMTQTMSQGNEISSLKLDVQNLNMQIKRDEQLEERVEFLSNQSSGFQQELADLKQKQWKADETIEMLTNNTIHLREEIDAANNDKAVIEKQLQDLKTDLLELAARIPKVDGGWSEWSSFSSCSATCGGGSQQRSRTCSNPTPAFGGTDCVGSNDEIHNCNTQQCSVVCPEGFVKLSNNKCYMFAKDNVASQSAASQKCIDLSATLLSVETSEENDIIKAKLRQLRGGGFYTSLLRNSSVFRWGRKTSGSAISYNNWGNGYPHSSHDCMIYSCCGSYHWQSTPCSSSWHYICEI